MFSSVFGKKEKSGKLDKPDVQKSHEEIKVIVPAIEHDPEPNKAEKNARVYLKHIVRRMVFYSFWDNLPRIEMSLIHGDIETKFWFVDGDIDIGSSRPFRYVKDDYYVIIQNKFGWGEVSGKFIDLFHDSINYPPELIKLT